MERENPRNIVSWKDVTLTWLYFLFAASFIIIPILTPTNTTYTLPIAISGYNWHIEGKEIWDFYAIALTMCFSILLLLEPDELPGIRYFFFAGAIIMVLCGAGLLFLGLRWFFWYQITLFIIIAGLSYVDGLMYKLSRRAGRPERVYKRLQYFVDIPIVLSLLFLSFHTGFLPDFSPPSSGQSQSINTFFDFFSGAIAFQFIIGNILILFFRNYEDIMNEPDRYSITTVAMVFFHPILKTTKAINDRKEVTNVPDAASNGTTDQTGVTSSGITEGSREAENENS